MTRSPQPWRQGCGVGTPYSNVPPVLPLDSVCSNAEYTSIACVVLLEF
jgi:hypothetical protein